MKQKVCQTVSRTPSSTKRCRRTGIRENTFSYLYSDAVQTFNTVSPSHDESLWCKVPVYDHFGGIRHIWRSITGGGRRAQDPIEKSLHGAQIIIAAGDKPVIVPTVHLEKILVANNRFVESLAVLKGNDRIVAAVANEHGAVGLAEILQGIVVIPRQPARGQ